MEKIYREVLRKAQEIYKSPKEALIEDVNITAEGTEAAIKVALIRIFGRDSLTPTKRTFIDLGLPSGVLWADKNEDGHFTFDEAQEQFGELMPKGSEFAELYEACKWKWDGDRHGYTVTGPNGNSIFLPAAGYRNSGNGNLSNVTSNGYYWSALPNTDTQGRYLNFSSGGVYPLSSADRAYGFSVRAVKRCR